MESSEVKLSHLFLRMVTVVEKYLVIMIDHCVNLLLSILNFIMFLDTHCNLIDDTKGEIELEDSVRNFAGQVLMDLVKSK